MQPQPQTETLIQGLLAVPGDPRLLQLLGSQLEASGDWPTLRRVFLQQLAHVPKGSDLEAYVAYLSAKACHELGESREALSLAGRAVQLNPGFAYGHHLHGHCLARAGRRSEAIAAQHRCAELAPTFPWCWFEIGRLQEAQGERVAAARSFREALERQRVSDPDHLRPIEVALADVEQALVRHEDDEAWRSLWPDRPMPPSHEQLPAPDRLALAVERFRLLLDRRGVPPA